jgi:hypothetical protein
MKLSLEVGLPDTIFNENETLTQNSLVRHHALPNVTQKAKICSVVSDALRASEGGLSPCAACMSRTEHDAHLPLLPPTLYIYYHRSRGSLH